MDPPTHGLLGAAIGQAFFARSLGRRAIGWGALLHVLPDVDIAAIPFAGELAEWKYHRGLTHGLWFAPVAGAALGWALWRWRERRRGTEAAGPLTWIALAVVCLLAHPLADAFTSYGTLLLWPSRRRFAWDALAIIDVLVSAALLLALVAGHAGRRSPRIAQALARGALAFCVCWEAYGLHLNRRAEAEARRQLEASGIFRSRGVNPRSLFELGDAPVPQIPGVEVHAYPVLLQPWLRRLVARGEGGAVGVGWFSTWRPGPIRWHFFRSASGPEVEAARRLEDVRLFEWFAMGQTTTSIRRLETGLSVEFDDLRYGFPTDPEHGLWGVRAAIGANGAPVGEVRRVRRPLPDARGLWTWLWEETFA